MRELDRRTTVRRTVVALERRSVCRTEPGEAIGITGPERGGRRLVACNRRATPPVISRASLATGGKLIAALVLAGALATTAGCPQRVATPKTTLKAYISALEAGDYGRAYALMSKSFRKEYDRDEFIAYHRRNRKDVAKNVSELKKGPSTIVVKAQFKYGEGNQLSLVREGGAWKLSLDPVSFYSQRTPSEALRSFVRALERRRYKLLLRFVPNQWRKVMTVADTQRLFSKDQLEATLQLIRNLKANLGNKIDVKGDDAHMLYGDSYKVEFKREDGVWKIVDAD
jgi:hypothetical protein